MHTIITITITRTSHLSGNVQCGIEIFAGYLAIGLRHFTEVPVSNHINLIKCVLLLLSSARMPRPFYYYINSTLRMVHDYYRNRQR